jgi:type IV secretion system protein VirB9
MNHRNKGRRAAPRRATPALVVWASLWSATLHAESAPVPGAFDSRVRTAAYNGDEVYRLRGFVGYQIDLEFESGEIFTGLGAGDLEALTFVGQDNHLFLKPKAATVATNLTVLTSKRHYQIDYTALAQKPAADDASVVYALRFTYAPPAAQSAADAAVKRLDSQLEQASNARPRNVDYWYCGETSIKPVAASDDGVHTRLRFAANAELPAIFVRNDDDSESLLNFSMESGDVIVHRVARRFILRRGRLTGCVVNQGFIGAGTRLESGTVAPDVERRIQGAAK